MAQIECSGLTLGYGSSVLVQNLDFQVNEGDYLCVVGENGSGKSTLMRTLLGLQDPLGGAIAFGDGVGQKQIGYLPQQTQVQRDFPASVREIVLSGCISRLGKRAFYTKEHKALAQSNMERLEIDGFASRCYRELSGGQQQRVLLARALCSARKLLLLDEPVTGLDPSATAEMYEIIEDLNKKDGISIIMISHDVHEVLRYASHILHIGRSCFFGTKEQYSESSVGKHYLGLEDLNV